MKGHAMSWTVLDFPKRMSLVCGRKHMHVHMQTTPPSLADNKHKTQDLPQIPSHSHININKILCKITIIIKQCGDYYCDNRILIFSVVVIVDFDLSLLHICEVTKRYLTTKIKHILT